jgi:hypothetical protein
MLQRFQSVLAPYLFTFHQQYHSVPLELTHAGQLDQNYQLQYRLSDAAVDNWNTFAPSGPMALHAVDGRWTSLRRMAGAAGVERE